MTAFTTLPFCTCPSGAASFTLAVITSPRPACRPVEPPSGMIICSLRAPELSATSSMDLIITAMFVSFQPCHAITRVSALLTGLIRRRRQLPAPAPSSARFPSVSSASASTTAAILRSEPCRRCALRSFRRARRTSSGSRSPACTSDAPFSASLRPRSSSASCSKRPCRSVSCGPSAFRLELFQRGHVRIGSWFPPLFFLRLAGGQLLLAQDGLDARNIPAQPANLFQALALSHIHLELQLEELVRQVPLLVLELDVG